MRYIGLDVHKDNITACVLSGAGKVVFEKDFKKVDGTCDCLEELFGHVGRCDAASVSKPVDFLYVSPSKFVCAVTERSIWLISTDDVGVVFRSSPLKRFNGQHTFTRPTVLWPLTAPYSPAA